MCLFRVLLSQASSVLSSHLIPLINVANPNLHILNEGPIPLRMFNLVMKLLMTGSVNVQSQQDYTHFKGTLLALKFFCLDKIKVL